MANQIFDYASNHTTGLTGTNGVEFNPFDFSSYGFTQTVKIAVDFDVVGIRDNEAFGGIYPNGYASKAIYIYEPSVPAYALVVNHVIYSDVYEIAWFVNTGSIGARIRAQGNPIQAGHSYNFCFSARMVACVHK